MEFYKTLDVFLYIQKYVPEIVLNYDFAFQETSRIVTAQKFPENKTDGDNGWLSINIIKNASNHEKIKISPEFKKLIQTIINELPEYPTNVQTQVEKIWMYPNFQYPNWCDLEDTWGLISFANDLTQKISPRFEIVNGKVCVVMDGFIQQLQDKFPFSKLLPEVEGLLPSFKTGHITVINSDVLAKCDLNEVYETNRQFNMLGFDITFQNIKHTISLDRARFSICVALSLKSEVLQMYLDDFNKTFGTSVKPSSHITFAVLPRAN